MTIMMSGLAIAERGGQNIMNKCKFCGKDGATEPISDEEGNSYLICEDCDFNARWERL